MIKKLKLSLFVYFFLALLAFSPNAIALTKGIESFTFRPSNDGGPYFSVSGSQTLGKRQWVVGTTMLYNYRPFQITQNGSRVQGIVDDFFVQHLYGSVGVVDEWLEVGLSIPVGWWIKFINPNIAGSQSQNKIVIGDIVINFKSELLKLKRHRFGIAFEPFVELPTGKGQYFFGAGNVAGGAKFAFEALPIDSLHLAFNAGILAQSRFDFRDIERTHQILYGFGIAGNITKSISASVEMIGRTRLTGPFKERAETPVEVLGGLKYAFANSGFAVEWGGEVGITHGSGSPVYGFFGGIKYKPSGRPPVSKIEERPKTDLIRPIVLLFDTDKWTITDNSAKVLSDVAQMLRNSSSMKIRVTGYTDGADGKIWNYELSRRRAERVKWYLTISGIETERMEAIGMGKANPRGDNRSRKGRRMNRRVEIEIIE